MKQEAEEEVQSLRAAADRKVRDLEQRYRDRLAAAAGEEARRAEAEAANQCRAARLAAEKELADRLLALSRSLLHCLRNGSYPAAFEKLALEVPSLPWGLVRVNPADVALVKRYFPGADIVPVDTIAGGVDVELPDATVRVVNTFEKRLDRAWRDLLPLLMQEAYQEAGDGPAHAAR